MLIGACTQMLCPFRLTSPGSHNGGMLRELSHAANDRTDILAVPAATTPAPAGSAAPAATERLKTIGK